MSDEDSDNEVSRIRDVHHSINDKLMTQLDMTNHPSPPIRLRWYNLAYIATCALIFGGILYSTRSNASERDITPRQTEKQVYSTTQPSPERLALK